jgi:conjugal transfer pilus assembly protein TraW
MATCKVYLISGLVMLVMSIALGSVLLASSGQIKNIGTIGSTYPVIEPDLAEEVRARINKVKMARIMDEHRQNYKAKDIYALPTAKRDRIFFVDMTFTLDHDIPGENGEIMYKRGLTWNPLEYVSPPELVVINGEDDKQREWFEKSPYSKNLKIKLLTSAGFATPLIQQLQRPVYYLTKPIADRLQLAAAPSVITKNGKKLMVQEVKIDE